MVYTDLTPECIFECTHAPVLKDCDALRLYREYTLSKTLTTNPSLFLPEIRTRELNVRNLFPTFSSKVIQCSLVVAYQQELKESMDLIMDLCLRGHNSVKLMALTLILNHINDLCERLELGNFTWDFSETDIVQMIKNYFTYFVFNLELFKSESAEIQIRIIEYLPKFMGHHQHVLGVDMLVTIMHYCLNETKSTVQLSAVNALIEIIKIWQQNSNFFSKDQRLILVLLRANLKCLANDKGSQMEEVSFKCLNMFDKRGLPIV